MPIDQETIGMIRDLARSEINQVRSEGIQPRLNIELPVIFQAGRTKTQIRAKLDTGAQVSVISRRLAGEIGAWRTGYTAQIQPFNCHPITTEVVLLELYFPTLSVPDKVIGGRFLMRVAAENEMPLIGMDILSPLGIAIDTKSGQVSIKNDLWEAFKTLAATGAIVIGACAILEALSELPKSNSSNRQYVS